MKGFIQKKIILNKKPNFINNRVIKKNLKNFIKFYKFNLI